MKIIFGVLAVAMLSAMALPGASAQDVGGGTHCALCTGLVLLVEQDIQVHNETVDVTLAKFCKILPTKWRGVCTELIVQYGVAIIELIEKRETPDIICHAVGICTTDPKSSGFCHLLPLPKDAAGRATSARTHVLSKGALQANPCKLPIVKELCDWVVNHFGNDHLPLDDFDVDLFSPHKTFRGSDWRGRDCNDEDTAIYPGRAPLNKDEKVDSDCNGIYGMDPETGRPYEELFCENTQQYGIQIWGDSAAAHFHLPPPWLMVGDETPNKYSDFWFALENELDWPMLSMTTGFQNTTWQPDITGVTDSLYLRMTEVNRCNHRDYQNLGVNGARSGAMNATIIRGIAREPSDRPVLGLYALVGNDVCNGHPGTSHMTTPDDMYVNVVAALDFLDTRLPKGSHVAVAGLADGRPLFDGLAKRYHPLGVLNSDITYEAFYDWLNCLSISPCRGWMNSNDTMRNLTLERRNELNAVLSNITQTKKYANFDLHYVGSVINDVLDDWVAQGGQIYQLIEPSDGFHPNSQGNWLGAAKLWDKLKAETSWIPPTNPHNDDIKKVFGDQGGH